MGLKDQIGQAVEGMKDAVEHGIADVKDAVNEARHRGTAEGEQAKRDVAGDELTPGEYAGSVINQGVNEVQANVDKAKRDVRDDVT